jgi:hypothetical protein
MEAWLIGIVAAVVLTAIGAVWRKSRALHLHAAGLSWTPWGGQLARKALAIERFASDHATASYLRSMNWNPSAKLMSAFCEYFSGRGDFPTVEQASAWYDEEFPACP